MNKKISQIDEPVVAININKTYRDGISAGELYDCTRGIWRLNSVRAGKARFAFAVYRGSVREIYEIDQWHKALTTEYKHRQLDDSQTKNRFEFVGKIAPVDIREKYLGKQMPEMHAQNPIRYYNC